MVSLSEMEKTGEEHIREWGQEFHLNHEECDIPLDTIQTKMYEWHLHI